MREKSKVIVGFDKNGNPIYAKQGRKSSEDAITRHIKQVQAALAKESEERE